MSENERWIRLIWDLRGEDAASIASHHQAHLKDFADKRGLPYETGIEAHSDRYQSAWIAVPESRMPEVRDALKPERGELHAD